LFLREARILGAPLVKSVEFNSTAYLKCCICKEKPQIPNLPTKEIEIVLTS